MSMTPAPRPGSVTVVVILTWIVAIMTALGGILFLLASDEVLADAGVASGDATAYGWVELILGALIALVALGLSGGANWSRILVSILMVIRLIAAVWAALVLPGTIGFWPIVFAAVIATAILAMLWTGRANEFFNTN